jgi:hypothetical protein
VVAFVVIISIAIFKIDWGGSKPIREAVRPINIADYADTDVRVRMSTRSNIINDEEHESLQITVGRDQTVGELMTGYQGNVIRTEQTSNNPTSYRAFLSALSNVSFTNSQLPPPGVQYDGACPSGRRYTFEFLNAGPDAPRSLWATSCGPKIGTFDGDLNPTKNLFNTQLPKEQYEALTVNSQF